jgi:hypothetical protein
MHTGVFDGLAAAGNGIALRTDGAGPIPSGEKEPRTALTPERKAEIAAAREYRRKLQAIIERKTQARSAQMATAARQE